MVDEPYLAHYGTPHAGSTPHSGRYKFGTGDKWEGKDPTTARQDIVGQVARLKAQGITNSTDIARALNMTTTEYRARYSVAFNAEKAANIHKATQLKDQGWSNTAIGREMGVPESTVRGWLKPGAEARHDIATDIASKLEATIPKDGAVDIGKGSELWLGTSADKLKVATQMLMDKGYSVQYIYEKQLTGGVGQKTTIKMLCAPGVKNVDIYNDRSKLKSVAKNIDDVEPGESLAMKAPVSIDGKRVKVVYAEDTFAGAKGIERDGTMLINPNAADLRLPEGKRYAQVRIAVDGTHYLKGMAAYGDPKDFPKGVDIAFNTNKHQGTQKGDVLKKMEKKKVGDQEVIDVENPFKASARQFYYVDPKTGKKKQSAVNVVNEEGDWSTWSKSLASQMLSKQSPSLAREQLNVKLGIAKTNFDEIAKLNNPIVKKKLLDEFADECDSDAVSLKAAAMPRQRSQVILPVNSLKSNEIYAPNFRDGESVVLVRYPHGGTFEMPALKVNNRNKEGIKLLGTSPKDAVGINAKIAEQLSGADFDGDTVLVIPNNKGKIKTSKPLAGLKDFDPKEKYSLPKDIKKGDPRLISSEGKQREMGKISNLITDMTIKGASTDDIEKAVRHSMVVIDSEKHKLDYKQSYKDNDIARIKAKYQGVNSLGQPGGASTLISRAGSVERVLDRKLRPTWQGGPIDKETGEKVYVNTGKTHRKAIRDKNGNITGYKEEADITKSTKLAEAKDAFSLSSGTQIESVYATYSNKMKALANQARKETLSIESFKVDPAAKKKYASNVKSMVAQLNEAKKNAPLQRKADVIANQRLKTIKSAHPEYDADDLKKIGQRELRKARESLGITRKQVTLTDTDWEAIQAHAVSANRLSEILRFADPDRVRELATPRPANTLSSGQKSRARTLLNNGYTTNEVAEALGISVSTLLKYID